MAKENRVGVSIKRTASEVKVYRRWMRLLPIWITISVILLIIGYIIAFLYTKYGAFTVMVNKFDSNTYALTLSESPSFDYFSSRLNAEIAETITNISGDTIPDWVDNVDGEHNGENYIAYTFYCMNGGKRTVTYTYDLYITNMTYEVEKAVRVRLYVDGEYTDYAHARTDGISGPEPGTTAFQSGNTIIKKTIRHFAPGDKTKFTVVIWLEGDDPDCVDKIIGGLFKIDMKISVDSAESNNEQT